MSGVEGQGPYGFFQPIQSVDDSTSFEEGFCLCETETAGCAGDAYDFSGAAELWVAGFCAEFDVLGGWLGLGLGFGGDEGHGVM